MARRAHVAQRPPLVDFDDLPVRTSPPPAASNAVWYFFLAACALGLALRVAVWLWAQLPVAGRGTLL